MLLMRSAGHHIRECSERNRASYGTHIDSDVRRQKHCACLPSLRFPRGIEAYHGLLPPSRGWPGNYEDSTSLIQRREGEDEEREEAEEERDAEPGC